MACTAIAVAASMVSPSPVVMTSVAVVLLGGAREALFDGHSQGGIDSAFHRRGRGFTIAHGGVAIADRQ